MKTEDLEAVSDGGLSEELEDVSEDEELECFKDSFSKLSSSNGGLLKIL